MRTIYKYPLPVEDESVILLPGQPKLLHVGEQHNGLVVWAEVEPEGSVRPHHFAVRGTGHPLSGREGVYLGTVQMKSGLVWHVYHRFK